MTGQNPGDTPPFQSLALTALKVLARGWPLVLRAALVPFALSVAAVYFARDLGAPGRYLFDAVHGLMVLAYVTALARISMGTYPGFGVMGFAIPRPTWPGLRPALGMAGEAAVLMLPTAVLLYSIASYLIVPLSRIDSALLNVVALLGSEFLLNTLLGLVVGAGFAKLDTDRSNGDRQ